MKSDERNEKKEATETPSARDSLWPSTRDKEVTTKSMTTNVTAPIPSQEQGRVICGAENHTENRNILCAMKEVREKNSNDNASVCSTTATISAFTARFHITNI